MKRLAFAMLTVLLSLPAGISAAYALSTESGNGMPGNFAAVTDPDEQKPPFLSPSGANAAADHFDSEHQGGGFVSQDVVRQSVARGSGSYLPPQSADEH